MTHIQNDNNYLYKYMFDMPDAGRETRVVKYVKKLHFYQRGVLKRDSISWLSTARGPPSTLIRRTQHIRDSLILWKRNKHTHTDNKFLSRKSRGDRKLISVCDKKKNEIFFTAWRTWVAGYLLRQNCCCKEFGPWYTKNLTVRLKTWEF